MSLHYIPARLENTEIFSLDEVEKLERLVSIVALSDTVLSPRWVEESGIDATIFTARTEGSSYSDAETVHLLKTGSTAGNKPLFDANMIVNARNGYRHVVSASAELVTDLPAGVKALHKLFMRGLLDDAQLGAARKTKQPRIGGTQYIPPSGVTFLESELQRLATIASTIEDPFSRSVYLACNVSYLQFFEDGNKRVSRAIQNAVLIDAGKPPLIYSVDAQVAYIEAQIAYYEQGDYSFHKGLMLESFQKYYSAPSSVDGEPDPSLTLGFKGP